MLARVRHTPTSEIYLRASVGHAPVHVGETQMGLVVDGSREVEEQIGVARLRVEFPKVDRSVFEKPKSKNFKTGWIRG
jgi:hypothetical protein